jgi:hypothetical protein
MPQITLVLPFALPAPEFAAELARALQAPALAALLSRTSAFRHVLDQQSARALPHEAWLAQSLGLEEYGQPGFAVAAMRGFGLAPAAGTWFIINPAHIEIARSHLMMPDLRRLALADADSRALFASARPYVEESGHSLEYGDATTWFLRADDWAGMDTATPDAAVGLNLTDCMPAGPHALAYRKLQNEIQMLWYTHPANAEREARHQNPVNAFWLWGGASVQAPSSTHQRTATFATPGWLRALGADHLATLDNFASTSTDTLLICGNVAAPALAADWGGWLHEMQRLETELFAPLLSALVQGHIDRLTLVMSNRTSHTELATTAMAQRKFWRRPTLERLT